MKKIIIYLALLSALSPVFSQNKAEDASSVTLFNDDWQFQKNADTAIKSNLFINKKVNAGWQKISLPHTANVEEVATLNKQWQGLVYYRKFFMLSAADHGKHMVIRIEAAMNNADIYLNGKFILNHKGGYLPFDINITDRARYGQQNCLLIRLNNQDNAAIPPGKPLKALDFNFYSGLYRNALLIKKQKLYLTDAVTVTKVNGGGVLLHWDSISAARAQLNITVDLQNDDIKTQNAVLKIALYNSSGKLVAAKTSGVITVVPGKQASSKQQVAVTAPAMWTPDHPNLYRLDIRILQKGKLVDSTSLKTGVRQIAFKPEGFYLNNKKYMLRGTNRHQEYPYLGYALSDNAQYRDAYKIKEAGFNFVRCSHYPPSPAFLNACDELGILVMDATPGWQFFGDTEFQNNSLSNISDMVHRDRNHPSIILWESSLNETPMERDYMEQAHYIVHAELPYPDTYTCGWMDQVYDVFIPARQHAKAPGYWKDYHHGKPIFLAEYGDWEYYAQNAGFNQTAYADLSAEEKTSRQLRGDGQKRMLQQALNDQEAHNDNLSGSIAGDANWLMFDYKRGYAPDIESSGIMDIFRLPKFAFYFYQSQRDPAVYPPTLFIANYWNGEDGQTVTIYSNCDEVDLWVNGRSLGKQKPDTGRMSNHLEHAPFTFHTVYRPGTIIAKGFIRGKQVMSARRLTPDEAYRILLRADYSGKSLSAGRNDVIFIYASVVDKKGTVVPDARDKLKLTLTGPGTVVKENNASAEAGIATFLVKAGSRKSRLSLQVSGAGLRSGNLITAIK